MGEATAGAPQLTWACSGTAPSHKGTDTRDGTGAGGEGRGWSHVAEQTD